MASITVKDKDLLASLLKRSGLKTQTELVNEALALLDMQLSVVEKGGSFPYQVLDGQKQQYVTEYFIRVYKQNKGLKNESSEQ